MVSYLNPPAIKNIENNDNRTNIGWHVIVKFIVVHLYDRTFVLRNVQDISTCLSLGVVCLLTPLYDAQYLRLYWVLYEQISDKVKYNHMRWGKIPLCDLIIKRRWREVVHGLYVRVPVVASSLYSDMKASCSIFSFYKCNERRLQTEYSLWDIHLLYLEHPFLLFARFFKSSTLQLTDFMVETIEGA